MPSLSGLKNSMISALRNPHEPSKPRLKRRVTPFNEALQNLRTSKTGFVTCAAFHSFGKCRKEITLGDSNFLANLDQLDMADIQTPIKLMPLMLCSSHWEKTIYYNALFLDWVSVYGSQHDSQHFENIVIDYQSAIAIENEDHHVPQIPVFPVSIAEPDRGLASAHCSPIRDDSRPNTPPTKDQSQAYIDHDEVSSIKPESDPSGYQPQNSVVVNMESYASIEFGVAKLEILYQEKLKCIAMSSNGWRCMEIISEEQLFKARELVSSSAKSDDVLDIELLLGSVLCPGHALGQLPQIYSEKWARFSEQRLSKDEAMSIFDADAWKSVQFFHSEESGKPSTPTKMGRPRSRSQECAPNDHLPEAAGLSASKGGDQPSIHTYSQDIIDRNLVKEMVFSFLPSYVYIRKSLDKNTGRNLVKIGNGRDILGLKGLDKEGTDAGCQLRALDPAFVDHVLVKDPERALKLIYAELADFRAKVDCQHWKFAATSYADEQEHIKWFNIHVNVAIESVRLWCSFVGMAYNSAGTIEDKWAKMATLLPKPSLSEIESLEKGLLTGDEDIISLHYELRNSRYKQWIKDGQSSNV